MQLADFTAVVGSIRAVHVRSVVRQHDPVVFRPFRAFHHDNVLVGDLDAEQVPRVDFHIHLLDILRIFRQLAHNTLVAGNIGGQQEEGQQQEGDVCR